MLQNFMLPAMKHTCVRLFASQSGQLYHRYVLLCYTLHRTDHGVKSIECYNATFWQFATISALDFQVWHSVVAWSMLHNVTQQCAGCCQSACLWKVYILMLSKWLKMWCSAGQVKALGSFFSKFCGIHHQICNTQCCSEGHETNISVEHSCLAIQGEAFAWIHICEHSFVDPEQALFCAWLHAYSHWPWCCLRDVTGTHLISSTSLAAWATTEKSSGTAATWTACNGRCSHIGTLELSNAQVLQNGAEGNEALASTIV